MNMMKNFFLSLIMILPLLVFGQPESEFRGVWIATVDNIDWPQRGVYNPASQQAEFIRLLDLHKKNGMNAVIVQIRLEGVEMRPCDGDVSLA